MAEEGWDEAGFLSAGLVEQRNSRLAVEKNNGWLRVVAYLLVFNMLTMLVIMILLLRTHVLGRLIGHLAQLSLFGGG